ncbi:hypothetical protein VTL71DRAFT_2314 [Oculimacula yallundae]|uniref:Uncharacterized protein n=1 Tax=Oculimacula yallundae TaxID=86028 RepID=A0ABR4C8K5_9HELO
MQLSINILLGLVAAASAVDLRFYRASTCSGDDYMSCSNFQPNYCCQQSTIPPRVRLTFEPIPSEWRLVTKGYTGGRCTNQASLIRSNGATKVCMANGGGFTGGGYAFVGGPGGKWDDLSIAGEGAAQSECLRPDTLVEAGVEYSTKDLPQAEYEALVEQFYNGTSASELATSFSALRLK